MDMTACTLQISAYQNRQQSKRLIATSSAVKLA